MLDLQRTTHDIECCMHFVDSCWTYNQNILTILMIICGPVDIQNMFFSEYGVLSNSVIFGGTVCQMVCYLAKLFRQTVCSLAKLF